MHVDEAINNRRSYRALSPIEINQELINSLGKASQLMCSCYNNQPWRFVFVYESNLLTKIKEQALSSGNRWAKDSSMIIAVFSKPDLDCEIGTRKYYRFDTGLAVGAMLLKATEMGLVAHPIAGFEPDKVHEILKIPDEYEIITLLIIGKRNMEIPAYFKDYQVKSENKRPKRKAFDEFLFHNQYKEVF